MTKSSSSSSTSRSHRSKRTSGFSSSDPDDCYCPDQISLIRKLYLLGIFAWIILVLALGLFPTGSIVEFIILLIPIGLFLLAWKSIPTINKSVEGFMFQTNLLTLGLLIALPILSWVYDKSKHNKSLFLGLISTAIIFSILALFDIWVSPCYLPVVKHIKSILQTFALALFVFLLYRFFVERGERDKRKKKESSTNSEVSSSPENSNSSSENSKETSNPLYYDL